MRACGAVIRDGHILMVRHMRPGENFWTLPGGGIHPGETPEQAAEREVFEETGLCLKAVKLLFSAPYSGGTSYCFLMSKPSENQEPSLGSDPEEELIPKEKRTLQGVCWHSLELMRDDLQVSLVIEKLGLEWGN